MVSMVDGEDEGERIDASPLPWSGLPTSWRSRVKVSIYMVATSTTLVAKALKWISLLGKMGKVGEVPLPPVQPK